MGEEAVSVADLAKRHTSSRGLEQHIDLRPLACGGGPGGPSRRRLAHRTKGDSRLRCRHERGDLGSCGVRLRGQRRGFGRRSRTHRLVGDERGRLDRRGRGAPSRGRTGAGRDDAVVHQGAHPLDELVRRRGGPRAAYEVLQRMRSAVFDEASKLGAQALRANTAPRRARGHRAHRRGAPKHDEVECDAWLKTRLDHRVGPS